MNAQKKSSGVRAGELGGLVLVFILTGVDRRMTLSGKMIAGQISRWTMQIGAAARRVVFARAFLWECGTLTGSISTSANKGLEGDLSWITS